MPTLLLSLHVAGGAAALMAMFVPMVARKGGAAHRRGGWVFVAGMTIVSVTAVVLSTVRLATDPTPGGRSASLFLLYVAVLTAAGVSAGVRVLRTKRRTAPHRQAWDVGLPAVLAAASAAMAAFGLATGRPLFVAFSLVGLANGVGQLRYWLRAPAHPMHWWFEHMGNMLGACIAATTAFLVVNAGRLGFESFAPVLWLSPAVLGGTAIAVWTAYYRRRFSGNPSRSQPREKAVKY